MRGGWLAGWLVGLPRLLSTAMDERSLEARPLRSGLPCWSASGECSWGVTGWQDWAKSQEPCSPWGFERLAGV